MNVDVSFAPVVSDLAEFEEPMRDYYYVALKVFENAGGPVLSPSQTATDTMDHLDGLLPHKGRLVLAPDEDGSPTGCGTLCRIRDDAVEMKRMFVRAEALGQGLGQRLFETRIEEVKTIGCKAVSLRKSHIAKFPAFNQRGYCEDVYNSLLFDHNVRTYSCRLH